MSEVVFSQMGYAQDVAYVVDGVLTADVTGAWIDIRNYKGICLHAIWTVGSVAPVGTFKVQMSIDQTNIEDYATQAAGGAAGSKMWNIESTNVPYVRLVYSRSSGGTGAVVDMLYSKKSY